ncbi:hypothetical protein [Teredinibacter turnerae]|uniref:hypothetical protein n=1 Tax=Teredinibacter turnerae TaxID=2426 RepID=UPI0013C4A952|nr:hypothetical protein [Teredinibacter turnerae]
MFLHKITNTYRFYFVALGVFVVEQIVIYFTPSLPHFLDWTQRVSIWLFYIHLAAITVYRAAIFVDHLRNHKKVKSFLDETSWRHRLDSDYSIFFELVHGFFTGLLTHLVLLSPWYFVITHFSFSLLFLPMVCLVNVWLSKKILDQTNSWYYRDHWLGHNSEFDFVYLHGSHHDAIPSGMIAVAGNGFLEGFTRYTLGYPDVFYNPLIAFFYFTLGIKMDIQLHQYIPGVFPRLPKDAHRVYQHSIHHFGKLAPYGYGIKVDQPDLPQAIIDMTKGAPESLANSIKLDEKLTGFKWDNAKHRWYLKLVDKYDN